MDTLAIAPTVSPIPLFNPRLHRATFGSCDISCLIGHCTRHNYKHNQGNLPCTAVRSARPTKATDSLTRQNFISSIYCCATHNNKPISPNHVNHCLSSSQGLQRWSLRSGTSVAAQRSLKNSKSLRNASNHNEAAFPLSSREKIFPISTSAGDWLLWSRFAQNQKKKKAAPPMPI